MNAYVLHLQSATRYERFENVTSFIAQDASGSFGILHGHVRMMTLLTFGLARFRVGEESAQPTVAGVLRCKEEGWHYLALPGALVYFLYNELFLNTRRYLRAGDYETVRVALREQFLTEEKELRSMKEGLRRLEEEMFKRLLDVNRGMTT
jgi:F-type H+-transporting ATPase subunit epsilon